MSTSPVARRPSPLALLISTVAVGAFWSAPAEATCPNGLSTATCNSICALNTTTHDYDCNVTNPGSSTGATAYAISGYTSGYHSVYGTDATGTGFCCEVAGSSVDKLILTGSSNADYLYLQSNTHTLDDLYPSGDTEGVANGGSEIDHIYGSRSATGTYHDTLNGDDDDDLIYGDAGDDVINAGGGEDYVEGGGGDDSIHGNSEVDEIFGDDGEDLIWGDAGSDILHGGDHNDTLRGEDDGDIVCGDEGEDSLFGGDSSDQLWGGPDQDTSNGGNGTDYCGSPAPGIFTSFCENTLASEPPECQ